MIESLTKEQEARMPLYVKKWVDIGFNTVPFTQAEAEQIIHDYQREILQVKETPVEVYDNPIAAWEAVEKLHGGEKIPFVYPYQDGSFFAANFAYYDFFISEKLVTLPADLQKKFDMWVATSKLGYIYPFDEVCIVCQKPTKINLDDRGRLHADGEQALQYKGWGFHALNGVTVPEYLAMTPAEDLKMDFFTKEQNADVKAEFVRKYGVERMLDLGKKIDDYTKYDQENNTWWWKSEYELWDMKVLFPGLDYQPYLRMKNQTTGIWHLEAVSPSCTTLQAAIKERFGGKEMRIVAIA